MPSNKALQTDKDKQSRLLHSQEPRQLAFAAELGCYTAQNCRRDTEPTSIRAVMRAKT